MNRYLQIMAVLIVAQLIVSVMVLWPSTAQRPAEAALYPLEAGKISAVELSDLQNTKLRLEKIADGWIVRQQDVTAPANVEQVEALIKALTAAPAGWPVSTSVDALSRFALADNDYHWKVTLSDSAAPDSSTSATFLFGSAAGAAKRHARRDNDATVYALNYALNDKLINARDWLQRDVLALPEQTITEIAAEDYSLVLADGQWRLADQAANESVDQDLVAMFTSRINSLRIDNLVSGELLKQLQGEKPLQTVRLKLSAPAVSSADTVKPVAAPVQEYRFYKLGDKHYVQRGDRDGFYELSLLAASDLLKIRKQWLIPGKVIAPQNPN